MVCAPDGVCPSAQPCVSAFTALPRIGTRHLRRARFGLRFPNPDMERCAAPEIDITQVDPQVLAWTMEKCLA
jgi:hypothetical protein